MQSKTLAFVFLYTLQFSPCSAMDNFNRNHFHKKPMPRLVRVHSSRNIQKPRFTEIVNVTKVPLRLTFQSQDNHDNKENIPLSVPVHYPETLFSSPPQRSPVKSTGNNAPKLYSEKKTFLIEPIRFDHTSDDEEKLFPLHKHSFELNKNDSPINIPMGQRVLQDEPETLPEKKSPSFSEHFSPPKKETFFLEDYQSDNDFELINFPDNSSFSNSEESDSESEEDFPTLPKRQEEITKKYAPNNLHIPEKNYSSIFDSSSDEDSSPTDSDYDISFALFEKAPPFPFNNEETLHFHMPEKLDYPDQKSSNTIPEVSNLDINESSTEISELIQENIFPSPEPTLDDDIRDNEDAPLPDDAPFPDDEPPLLDEVAPTLPHEVAPTLPHEVAPTLPNEVAPPLPEEITPGPQEKQDIHDGSHSNNLNEDNEQPFQQQAQMVSQEKNESDNIIIQLWIQIIQPPIVRAPFDPIENSGNKIASRISVGSPSTSPLNSGIFFHRGKRPYLAQQNRMYRILPPIPKAILPLITSPRRTRNQKETQQ